MDDHPVLTFNKLVPKMWEFIAWVEQHHVEVRGEGEPPNGDQMVRWGDDETVVTMVIRIPNTETCWGCGQSVPRPDHHYGSLGNGRHAYQWQVNGEWVKFEYPKSCASCLIEAEFMKPCASCGGSVWYGE